MITLLGLALLSACDGGGGGGGGGGGDDTDPCAADPCAGSPGTVCVEGVCVDPTFTLEGAGAAFTGTFTPDGGVATRFGVEAADGGATAYLETDAGRVDVALTDAEHVTLTFGGVSFDGAGSLSDDERAAIGALLASDVAPGLSAVPLKLGCTDATLDPAAVAALLAPWQAVLKYGTEDRTQAARAAALASGCGYFEDDGGRAPTGAVLLNHEDIIPLVFGFFPFDGDGELTTSVRAAGDLTAACGARCRGACGGDCQPVNCDQVETEVCDLDPNGVNSGYVIAALEHICGTADGCQAHDDCYDTCNSQSGCGTWDAAVCRRGCDEEAIGQFGFQNCQAWAMGLGPFSGFLHFTYPVEGGAARHDEATCPIPAGTLQWEDPPAGGEKTLQDAAAYCEALVLDGHEDWRMPSMPEILQLERGCPINDCSGVDNCTGCAWLSGPTASGCYWDAQLQGACAATWTSSPFAYQAGMYWVEIFQNGSAAIQHDLMPAAVRCVRVAP